MKGWLAQVLRRTLTDYYRRAGVRKAALQRLSVQTGEGQPVLIDDEAELAVCSCLYRILPTVPADYSQLNLADRSPRSATQQSKEKIRYIAEQFGSGASSCPKSAVRGTRTLLHYLSNSRVSQLCMRTPARDHYRGTTQAPSPAH